MILIAIISVLLFIGLIYFVFKSAKKTAQPLEIVLGIAYIFSLVLFGAGMLTHNEPYYKAIDPIDECYSPFSDKHFLTLFLYFIAFNISVFIIWTKGKKMPPLTLVLTLVFLLLGTCLSAVVLLQVTKHSTKSLYGYERGDDTFLFLFAPFVSMIIGILLIIQVITEEAEERSERSYKNKILDSCNKFLSRQSKPLWVLLLLLPVFFVVTLVLILFGQHVNSVIKVFTDTTTWRFSQQIHPPVLDHKGHYLCTVAALGNPKIVKPIRLGKRGGRKIIVNRQLLIANAFEEMIEELFPKLHRFIRFNYDKYGYNLSQKIVAWRLSNLTYILMKPLEWLFLTCLYLFCQKPEERIIGQYVD